MKLHKHTSAKSRRKALETWLGTSFEYIGKSDIDESVAGARNCENMIGATQMPLGVAGPLMMDGGGSQHFIPLATTEGALVASVNRGCKALALSGGVVVEVERVGATRGPVFHAASVTESKVLTKFLSDHFQELQKVAAETSNHLTLTSHEVQKIGRHVFVRFVFDTQDAMGLNMVTIATDKMALFIESKTGVVCEMISGNYCVDKKPSYTNLLKGRGFRVHAEIVLSKNVITSVLKTTAQALYDGWLVKCMLGSAASGSMGFNAQYANVIAAFFIATGQDPAHVVEGSMGITTTEYTDASQRGLYVSVTLPSVLLGTVGGGTGLATQKEALSMMGIDGGDGGKNAAKLARILGGAVLAGEISLLASLSEGTLAQAHVALARGGK